MPGHGLGKLPGGCVGGVVSVTGVMSPVRMTSVMCVMRLVLVMRVTCVVRVMRLLCRGSPHRVGRHRLRGALTSRLMRVMMPGTMMPMMPVVGMMGVLHVPGRVGTGQHPRHRGCERGHQEQPEHGS